MHIITEILLFFNLLDWHTSSVKLVRTTKPMETNPLDFCIHWDFPLL